MSENKNEMAERIAQLEALVEKLSAPKAVGRAKAVGLVIDGVTLANKPTDHVLSRLTAAGQRNLERLIPLRLKAMGLSGQARLVKAVPPYIEVQVDGETEPRQFGILSGTGDWTDYYFNEYK